MLNIILHEAQRLSFANEELLQKTFHKWTNVHRISEALEFVRACIYKKVTPCFGRIPPNEIRSLGINSKEQNAQKTVSLFMNGTKKLETLQNEFDKLSNEILSLCNSSIQGCAARRIVRKFVAKNPNYTRTFQLYAYI